MSASLFLANVTCVDHAYIDNQGCIIGGSFNPSFEVTGEVTSDENVVIDFSKVKKIIKDAIDDKVTGLDHKLHLYSNSAYEVQNTESGVRVITPYLLIEGDGNFHIEIPGEFQQLSASGKYMSRLIYDALRQFEVRTSCINSRTAFHYRSTDTNLQVCRPMFFRYVHGLRQSSSYACQNIAHGHLSYVQLMGHTETNLEHLATAIAHGLNNCIFVWLDNVTEDDNYWHVRYNSQDRGEWYMRINKDIPQKVIILSKETTIEHIVREIVVGMLDELRDAGVEKVLISEGLTKGSLVHLKDI